VAWQLLDNNTAQAVWDHTLAKFPKYHVFQSYRWGEFRRQYAGVMPYRWMAMDEQGGVVGLFQGCWVGTYFGIAVLISDGGPAGDLESCFPALRETVRQTLGVNKCYCRTFARRPYHLQETLLLKAHAWQRALYGSSSGWSMTLDLQLGQQKLLQGLTKNWQRNLHRAYMQKMTIEAWDTPDIHEILSIYREMEAYKGLPAQFSAAELSVLLETFGDQVLIYRCLSPQGDVLGLRGCLFTGTQALDYFAATRVHARKMYVSYALMWELLHACIDKGITHYDLNGIDPYTNEGVYHFKKGTGAVPLEYLGEWDCATSEGIRIGMNLLRATKQRFNEKTSQIKSRIRQRWQRPQAQCPALPATQSGVVPTALSQSTDRA
jgi:hypothetical protein